jgi:hypothetical protein
VCRELTRDCCAVKKTGTAARAACGISGIVKGAAQGIMGEGRGRAVRRQSRGPQDREPQGED